MRRGFLPWVCLVGLGLTGCNIDPFHIGGETDDDGAQIDADVDEADADTQPTIDAAPPDASPPDACIPLPETCNELDDDCDGMVDEDFDTDNDPAHCGGCGLKCQLIGTEGTCSAGMCSFTCLPGFHDNDGLPGCEYPCLETNGGVEQCDGLDNDCDVGLAGGGIDEGIDLESDVENCGACGHVCQVLHADATCSMGECGHGPCDPGFADLLPSVPGCEYSCPVFPLQPETCNGKDDDCDGEIDDGNPGAGQPCGSGVGECDTGTTLCVFGTVICQGGKGPTNEICDGKDNDCDTGQPGGGIDEGFDKQNDPFHCGAACTVCNLPNAAEKCVNGVCQVNFCLPGFINFNGTHADGCEFECTPTGPEVCDGLDNDCDKLVDAADPSMAGPPPGLCRTQGACSGATATCKQTACDAKPRFRCNYGANVQKDACGEPILQETLCDGLDNDCDNASDESFPLKNTACDDGELGLCRGTGTLQCNAAKTGLTCNITSSGAGPTSEICDGLDQDCDGELDNGAPDVMVHVDVAGEDFYIYRYEASRPDATGALMGDTDHRACSKAGVQPWRSVTWEEADAACAAAGKRLCTEEEWELACAGAGNLTFPYGNTYQPDACNGEDHDPNCTGPDTDVCLPTGSSYDCPGAPVSSACVSPVGANDMSGNLKEWTSTVAGMSPLSYRIRGGGFDSIAPGLTCQFAFQSGEPDFLFDNLGFRCCSDAP